MRDSSPSESRSDRTKISVGEQGIRDPDLHRATRDGLYCSHFLGQPERPFGLATIEREQNARARSDGVWARYRSARAARSASSRAVAILQRT